MPTIPTILVVDDEPANRKLLADIVAREGYVALTATGGAEALACLASRAIDLVFLDVMMPEVDGLTVLGELQRRALLPGLPVVVVTAHDDRKVRIDALKAGAVDFITKPIDRLEVACRLHTLIEIKQLRERMLATTEGRLRESDHLLRLGFEQSPVAKISWDTAFRISAWNPAAQRLFGYTREEALGQHVSFLLPEAQRSGLEAVWNELLGGAARAPTHENLSKDERTLSCEWHIAPLTRADGSCVGASAVVLDVTERARLAHALAQSQKMDAMGKLAGGVAHDFNNILAAILSYGTFLRDALPVGDARRDDVLEVLKAADRAAGLTRQLLAFARQQPTEKRATDLNHSLAQLHKLLTRTLGDHIELVVSLAARQAVVLVDPIQFDQVVLNLAVNARDAMPQGGRLQIALDHPPMVEGAPATVQLKVCDTGSGMDEATQRRIFEPFFTTKAKGQGTGLGLAMCFGIVADAGGTISVASAPGEGTTFTVALPLVASEVDTRRDEAVWSGHGGAGEVVLVVEDDAAIRRGVARVLGNAGYDVHLAADAHEAMGKLDELAGRLDLLLTDVVMPGPGGHAVAAHARQVAPQAAVLMTSGFASPAEVTAHAMGGDSDAPPILWKPVAPHDLVRAVAGALGARRPAGGAEGAVATVAPLSRRVERPSSVARERVLFVEDDAALTEVGRRALEADFEVVVAGTLQAARDALEGGEFAAMVLDIGLPDGTGIELLGERRLVSSQLPVVMMTGALSAEAAAHALRRRVRDYLPKPFAPDELGRVVRAAADAGRMARLRTKLLAARHGSDVLLGDLPGTERRFASALQRIRMVFQPIVRAADGSTYGFEALMRCDEPSLASPLQLLAAAEVLGRMDDLGRAVRRGVAGAMRAESGRLEALFVNLHPLEVRAELLAEVTDPLRALAHRVVLEITERASVEAGPKLDQELAQIRKLGYRIAVDDLGEGYAGLASLVHLRPDIAKIDMSLVRDIDRAPLKRDIVAALVDVARRAGITVVAEGIETIEERRTLIDLGCDLLQGYLIAKPGPPFPVARSDFG